MKRYTASVVLLASLFAFAPAFAQIGRRFSSEKKIVTDPVTGAPLSFLTSSPAGDSKIVSLRQACVTDEGSNS
jgi:oligogalacturonide lyase